jgi:uncharacterized protein
VILDLRELEGPAGRVSGAEVVRVDDPLADEVDMPCRVDVSYRQAGGAFHLHAAVEGTLSTRCHRCLEPVSRRVEGEFDLIVRRGENTGEAGDDEVVLSLQQHTVDLDPRVRETMVLNMPMIVLCAEACRGLCPTCGANRNRETCECRPDADPRWDALHKG